jgi:hypothetical protein
MPQFSYTTIVIAAAATTSCAAASMAIFNHLTRGSWFLGSAIVQPLPNLYPNGGGTDTAIADLDGDGYPEIISGYETSIDGSYFIVISVAQGTATGTWSPNEIEWTWPVGPRLSNYALDDIHAVDANGDQWIDLVVQVGDFQDSTEVTYYTLLNSQDGNFRCFGDTTGDGQTDVNDILTVIEDWGCDEGDPLN